MTKQHVCKNCKVFTTENTCPVCKKNAFSTNWKGRIAFINTTHSLIAHKLNVSQPGEYAIKIR